MTTTLAQEPNLVSDAFAEKSLPAQVPKPASEQLIKEQEFEISASVRYHIKRRYFFERFNKWATGLQLIFGSTIFVTILGEEFLKNALTLDSAQILLIQTIVPAMIVVISIIDLLISSATMARLHETLAHKFSDLLTDIEFNEMNDNLSLKYLSEIIKKRRFIEKEEPVTMITVYTQAYNDEMYARGDFDNMIHIAWWKKLLFPNLFNWSVKRNTDC